eukprot:CAMPEP_0119140864 /NCGR_PEP_ID=MMETSP1310-20130426/29948_1 /TAXON_ID=464262 /ORGANISM="Genus nov. species nov., Strain RCC2339" /LENGTH=97 /DNA_ID=CAMNT_0007132257 /DNA_START=46 /DNA_END=336 /DNA_ORIENTATION=-
MEEQGDRSGSGSTSSQKSDSGKENDGRGEEGHRNVWYPLTLVGRRYYVRDAFGEHGYAVLLTDLEGVWESRADRWQVEVGWRKYNSHLKMETVGMLK